MPPPLRPDPLCAAAPAPPPPPPDPVRLLDCLCYRLWSRVSCVRSACMHVAKPHLSKSGSTLGRGWLADGLDPIRMAGDGGRGAAQDPWVSSGVLVESFEPGSSVERFIRNPQPFNTEVCTAPQHRLVRVFHRFSHTSLRVFECLSPHIPLRGCQGTYASVRVSASIVYHLRYISRQLCPQSSMSAVHECVCEAGLLPMLRQGGCLTRRSLAAARSEVQNRSRIVQRCRSWGLA